MVEDLTQQFLNLADDGTIRLSPETGTLEVKAHNEDVYSQLDLAELTDSLPEAPLSEGCLAELEAALIRHLSLE